MANVLVFGKVPWDGVPLSKAYNDLIITNSTSQIKRRAALEDYVLIIIDLDGCEKRGMEIARYIRTIPRHYITPMLFFSRDHKLEWAAFHKLHCYDFYIKPLGPDDILSIMYLYLQKTDRTRQERVINFEQGPRLIPVNIDEILYLESINRKTILHTTTSEIAVSHICLSDFITENPSVFLQIHRSTVVNITKIRCINTGKLYVELKNTGEVLSIGRTFLSDIRKTFDGI